MTVSLRRATACVATGQLFGLQAIRDTLGRGGFTTVGLEGLALGAVLRADPRGVLALISPIPLASWCVA